MTARITYNSVNFDFSIKSGTLDIRYLQERNVNRSSSGKIETINQYGSIEVTFTAQFTLSQFRQAYAFYAWARQGQTFSFAVNNTLTVTTNLDGVAAAAQTTIPLASTTGLSSGEYCLVRAEDQDDEYEIIIIDTVNAGVSVVAVDNLVYSYTTGDLFRHWQYWPDCVLMTTTFNPTDITKVQGLYTCNFTVVEDI